MINFLWVATGGFLGAISRYLTVLYVKRKFTSDIPAGTLAVNLLGSFLLGLLIGLDFNENLFLLLGVGFMGAFTTFSTFKFETFELLEGKKKKQAVTYLIFTYAGGILFAFAGLILGKIE
ncbi:fluoride efflux transporter CrcB [Bacillus sp. ISL-47]|uniref:fluoride efflux transporter CrcB n=1 Tax=Bacillus sp. ISL-47 TaxID=2819130 RepID=UPI001BEC7998|nr:fluoride efflux transporter CrcB [Bacillus sp. ISL-47]MBT2691212.1 fluoride efflux transporter CrcB [Bacillus sp. ISL-47]MBT2709900.1 fluoride efflux transporter CrcB [Pseudomonas sp. ISL-84]